MEGGFNACGPNFNRAISGSMPRNDAIVPAKKNRKELRALAAGLPTIFQDREDVAPEGLRTTGSANAGPR
jgi:hypothetical protein